LIGNGCATSSGRTRRVRCCPRRDRQDRPRTIDPRPSWWVAKFPVGLDDQSRRRDQCIQWMRAGVFSRAPVMTGVESWSVATIASSSDPGLVDRDDHDREVPSSRSEYARSRPSGDRRRARCGAAEEPGELFGGRRRRRVAGSGAECAGTIPARGEVRRGGAWWFAGRGPLSRIDADCGASLLAAVPHGLRSVIARRPEIRRNL